MVSKSSTIHWLNQIQALNQLSQIPLAFSSLNRIVTASPASKGRKEQGSV